MEFQDLMAQLREDCHKYHFCQDGLRGVAKATSVENCVAMLRENIVYCFNSDYHQAIAENVDEWYLSWKDIFNRCGVWVNEIPSNDKGIVILTKDCSHIFSTSYGFGLFGKTRCFVFGDSPKIVGVFDHAKIYSKNENAIIILCNHAHGFIQNAVSVKVLNDATCYADHVENVACNSNSRLFLTHDCKLDDQGHKSLEYIEHFSFQ